jgi:hybrid cluster-associated redox disulfide protein
VRKASSAPLDCLLRRGDLGWPNPRLLCPASNKNTDDRLSFSGSCCRAKSVGKGAANSGQHSENATLEAVMSVESTQLVDDVMRRWPTTIRVFLNYKMRCVGCPIACFHTVDDACREHEVERMKFLADLQAAIVKEPEQTSADPGFVTTQWPAGS